MNELSHFDAIGNAQMVDVGDKPLTHRVAVAEGKIIMHPETLNLIQHGGHKKGDVLGVARLAGIMAAKKTSDLIPLCHPLFLTHIHIELTPQPTENAVCCWATVETHGATGVEMEALMAVQIALLTVYDMCKAVDRGMSIEMVRLCKKSGGQSGTWERKMNLRHSYESGNPK
ncbi:MAG: molybdenum cofactor biosynthesis protein C [Beggiatoa sp. IS2]|nr:MAG: molybdenum cofactor biosynthesis protein C [Beggiatoa sp. IS2]